eukprot:CAMPEP_0172568460 /NCGR_PEP_ID=MMETSP1067-20121228/120063_1 /TAXON_ID=265564 ORGANISM="Thalassiosira punctigera, Strain Tpunct2005C2" /NCGR_SAMPLE_ID=MMETSP1067 /ASSEMBLY_ACC=CAM_ASM_000444 /LENGTH=55 /DNA_ID=CAMNT_0013360073 /DNA_START=1 /DNA_END=165 /DNA_ORIENTATION=-
MAKKVSEMIERGNRAPTTKTGNNGESNGDGKPTPPPHFPYESCRVLDVGRLPSQH